MAFGECFMIAVAFCILFNAVVVALLLKKGNRINYLDLVLVSLAISDALQAAVGDSIEIQAFYSGNELVGNPCLISGFSTTFLGLVSIAHLVGITVMKHVILKYPLTARIWSKKPHLALYIILPSWFYGLVWALLPIFGWGSYTPMKGHHLCGIDLVSQDLGTITYNCSLLFWCFFCPILVISTFSYLIYKQLHNMRNEGQRLGLCNDVIESRRKMERKQSMMGLVMILMFIMAWSPYAICVLILTANGPVSATLLIYASVLAKMSSMYNPIIYLLFMGRLNERLGSILRNLSRNGSKRSETSVRTNEEMIEDDQNQYQEDRKVMTKDDLTRHEIEGQAKIEWFKTYYITAV